VQWIALAAQLQVEDKSKFIRYFNPIGSGEWGLFLDKMQIEELYNLFLLFPKIGTDTRKDIKSSIFFCLSGENFNGNQFALKAIEYGASYAVVDDNNYWTDDSRFIKVKSSLETLQQLAAYHRKLFDIPTIGITGTNGKTTTKELITAVLSKKYSVTSTQGNFNNHIGVPLTLLQLNKQTEIAIIEMGANQPDEIESLCSLALPNFGIITNIGKAHLEGFGSQKVIKRTKLALYHSVDSQKGKLFVNFDDPTLKAEAQNLNYFSYGHDVEYDIHGIVSNEFPFLEILWGLKTKKNKFDIKSKLLGNYNFSNILAAISVGHYFGLSPENISDALENYEPKNNRSQFIKGVNNELILDAYNANPDSLSLAIASFEKDRHTNKAVIIGDMFELGKFAAQEHKSILNTLKTKSFKTIILVGSLFKKFEKEYPKFHFFENTNKLIEQINSLNINEMRILIKGSRGVKLELLKDYLI
jgi:UDP-N-acetylmuramoyl-tripeptide--D-alanyl-D-alanine ligase